LPGFRASAPVERGRDRKSPRAGLYVDSIAEEVAAERLKQFFVKEHHHCRIAQNLRDRCIVARQDVTRNSPVSRLNLVGCRNLLIYLDTRAVAGEW